MTSKSPCPRCGYLLSPHHYSRHLRSCSKIPLDDELRKIAPTMTVTQMGNLWGVNHSSVKARLDRMGVTAGKDWRIVPPTQEQVARMMELYDGGVPVYEIAPIVGVPEGRAQRTILRLLTEGKLTKREKVYTPPQTYSRCKVCNIRLNGPGVPDGDGDRCGFCVGPEPGREVMEAGGAQMLAEDVLVMGDRDARSKNGHRERAREWLGSGRVYYWLDVLGCDRGYIKARMAAEGVL